ncbi:MAG: NAD-dependent deacylase [Desulfobacterales bacterium]|nr:NAD-dependent deacylase [Desulfobacterales bacterium]
MMTLIEKAAQYIANAKQIVALTGAGISVESGIPPFRGKGGLWEKFDPMEYAHIDVFLKNPKKVWDVMLKEMKEIIQQAKPNNAHLGLAKLEQMGKLKTIITQNIDGLHQMAGNSDVIEFHGNFAWLRCLNCSHRCAMRDVNLDVIPPTCSCGGIYRPDCVFFGEMIPMEALTRSQSLSKNCDVMLVIGTSAVVQPAALMPMIAKDSGAKIIEINAEPTPLTYSVSDVALQGNASEIIIKLIDTLQPLV